MTLEEYILQHSEPEPDYLYRLWRATNIRTIHGRMASGHLQTLAYKFDIERNLRTPDYAGFLLLGLNDYSGQICNQMIKFQS